MNQEFTDLMADYRNAAHKVRALIDNEFPRGTVVEVFLSAGQRNPTRATVTISSHRQIGSVVVRLEKSGKPRTVSARYIRILNVRQNC
jgi:hypothetical protein